MDVLKPYLSDQPLLLLFTPEASSPEYITQWDMLYKQENTLLERGLRVMSLFEEEGGDIDGEDIDEAQTEALRRHFRIKRGMSAAIILDASGKEKKRCPLPAAVPEILATLG